MNSENSAQLKQSLALIYKDEGIVDETLNKIKKRFSGYGESAAAKEELSEKDTMLITYGNSLNQEGKNHLSVLASFLEKHVKDAIKTIHLLPMYPYTSDDGFSVVDYMKINPSLGTWEDIEKLAAHYHLMFDAVINHISHKSGWFQGFLECRMPYRDFFITADPNEDYHAVIRPRTSPLLTKFETKEGLKHVWTTFSADQIDLNFKNPDLLIEVLDILVQYAKRGAKFIRLDAIGFLWKESGTSCMHLPETHEVIKLARKILDIYAPGTFIITETNVPHEDNISYFGNGEDEAHLVYQFPLPPLVMFSFLKGSAKMLSSWAEQLKLPEGNTSFFNFLSSHDGIGIRPVEGILAPEEIQFLVTETLKSGGEVSYKDNGDGSKSPYELNINYQDCLAKPDESDDVRIKKFLAAETLLLSMQGIPGIYIHSLLGSRNDYYGKTTSGILRRINREQLNVDYIEQQLSNETNRRKIFDEIIRRLTIRKANQAFSPSAPQTIKKMDDRVFYIIRQGAKEHIHVLINVSDATVEIPTGITDGVDLITGRKANHTVTLQEWDTLWIKTEQ